MMKMEGSGSESGSESGSGSISQRHGSADPDPDPHQNVMDPQHCSFQIVFAGRGERRGVLQPRERPQVGVA